MYPPAPTPPGAQSATCAPLIPRLHEVSRWFTRINTGGGSQLLARWSLSLSTEREEMILTITGREQVVVLLVIYSASQGWEEAAARAATSEETRRLQKKDDTNAVVCFSQLEADCYQVWKRRKASVFPLTIEKLTLQTGKLQQNTLSGSVAAASPDRTRSSWCHYPVIYHLWPQWQQFSKSNCDYKPCLLDTTVEQFPQSFRRHEKEHCGYFLICTLPEQQGWTCSCSSTI